ncbi:hypothetical protein P7C70_g4907, partial [Phenoliferia sp. Uapishka_3]
MLSGLAYMLAPVMGESEWKEARFSAEVLRAMRGGAKVKAHVRRRAVPLPHSEYLRAVKLGLATTSYDTLLWATQTKTMFLSCGRAGELLDADSEEYRDAKQHMRRETTYVTVDGFRSYLPYQKASPLYAGSHYFWVTADAGEDALRLISKYMRARDAKFGPTGPLWLNSKGEVPRRRWYVNRLKRFCGKQYTGHSMRPGGATWYVLCGADDRTVQRLGRWKSASWEDYIRMHPEVAMAARIRDAARRNPGLTGLGSRDAILAALRAMGVLA